MTQENTPDPPKFYVSMGMKVQTRQFENQDISFGISGISVDCSAEYLQQVIEAGISRQQIVINAFAAELDRILREDFGR